MILVLAEKKDVAIALSTALPGAEAVRKESDVFKQDQYYITWLSGHMMELKMPEDYDIRYKTWSIEQLPINFPDWDIKPKENDPQKAARLKKIVQWMREADAIIHAGDPDQEGQLLVDEILHKYKNTKKVLRVNTSDTTTAGLKYALDHMTDNQDHESEGWSAYARSVADLLVGVNMSRLFTRLNSVRLSVGRVQTPTLGLVVARDALIEGHTKIKYYTISGTVHLEQGKAVPVKYEYQKEADYLTEGRLLDKQVAEQIAAKLNGQKVDQIQITKKIEYEKPPLPFNMVKLQSYCSSKFSMSLEKTMEVSQRLRDDHKAITYNRSDCQYLTDNHFDEAPATMLTVVRNIRYKPKELDMRLRSDCFKPEKVKLHHAIIPQNTPLDMAKLSEDEKNVYLAIAKFYMAQFMPPAKKEVTRLKAVLKDGGTLTATSTEYLNLGYRTIFKELEPDEKSTLSALASGTYSGVLQGTAVTERETKPPARYTQATLAEDMTCISKYVKDPRIKRLLREKDKNSEEDNGSIGTVATRTPIIVGLIKKGFLIEEGKHLRSSPLGRELFRILPDEVKGVDMTAEWWVICESIVSGDAKPSDLQNSVLEAIREIIQKRDSYPKINAEAAGSGRTNTIGKCPRCGGDIFEGKKGFGCSNWKSGCKFVIWKSPKASLFKDVTITKARAADLLDGKVVKIDNFWSEAKQKRFAAGLRITDENQSDFGAEFKLEFNTEDKPKMPSRKNPTRKPIKRSSSRTERAH